MADHAGDLRRRIRLQPISPIMRFQLPIGRRSQLIAARRPGSAMLRAIAASPPCAPCSDRRRRLPVVRPPPRFHRQRCSPSRRTSARTPPHPMPSFQGWPVPVLSRQHAGNNLHAGHHVAQRIRQPGELLIVLLNLEHGRIVAACLQRLILRHQQRHGVLRIERQPVRSRCNSACASITP